MAENNVLEAKPREALRKQNKALRRSGVVPVHVYGQGAGSMPLEIEEKALRRALQHATGSSMFSLNVAGKSHNVMLRNVQRHPINGDLIHVDLLEIRMDQAIKVKIPVAIVGEAPAVKTHDAMIQHLVDSLTVEGLPGDLPHRIEIDVSELTEVDQAIHVKDIHLAKAQILDDPEELVVKVQQTRAEAAEEAAAAEAAHGAEAPAAAAESSEA